MGLIMAALREEVGRSPRIHGVTCLAEGADQLFAEAVIEAGGTFEVILPASDYREAVITFTNRPQFDRLLSLASSISYMPFARSHPEAYQAANAELLRRSCRLIAVWDGGPAADVAGTSEVVNAALAAGIEVRTVWPEGASRREDWASR
jgi:hypothetical protein